MPRPPLSILRFDMRAPDFSPASPAELYHTALEMARFADEKGFHTLGLSEHHGSPDGFLPSPLVMAGALAGCTRRIHINVSALIVPLRDPIALAEELAVLDLVSAGRVSLVAGLGYRPEEYAAAGRDWERRGDLFDECLAVLLRALEGEAFDYRGRRVHVTPRPATRPHPLLMVGGSSPAAARRAARFGLPFAPPLEDPELVAVYHAECARLGRPPGFVLGPGEPAPIFVSRDPERSWREIGPYLLHDALSYASWQRPGLRSYAHSRATSVESLRREGKFKVMTPEECISHAEGLGTGHSLMHAPLVGGLPPALGWESLELFAAEVMPRLG
jgi:alkanesulfonate monooxygenase SsuD/methylene tetrahydromethanopterin reductase-like flavin-dependent oxidoreductase (luciferase family)